MNCFAAIVVAVFLCLPSQAQENEPARPADIIQSVQDFLLDDLDPAALEEAGLDPERIRQFLADMQKGFEGTNIFELASLHQTATNILPVLQRFEETQPYAAWLETRLDYLATMDELRFETGPTNKFRGGRLPNPSPEIERKVWNQSLERRPAPARAAMLVPVLKPIFASEQVPPELVWLAEVESSFNPAARSPVGAAGLYQLMPATAESLKLSLTPQDERLLPEKNARAAASYLRYLNKRFNDWRLVLAAYNAGEGRVSRLLKNSKTKTFDAIAGQLPAETQMYVPRVEATVNKREGIKLADLKPPPHPTK